MWSICQESMNNQKPYSLITLKREDAHILLDVLNTLSQQQHVAFPTEAEAQEAMKADTYQRLEAGTPEWKDFLNDPVAGTRKQYFGENDKIPSVTAEEMTTWHPAYNHERGEFGFASAIETPDTEVDRIQKPQKNLSQTATELLSFINEGAQIVYANGGLSGWQVFLQKGERLLPVGVFYRRRDCDRLSTLTQIYTTYQTRKR